MSSVPRLCVTAIEVADPSPIVSVTFPVVPSALLAAAAVEAPVPPFAIANCPVTVLMHQTQVFHQNRLEELRTDFQPQLLVQH